MINQELLEYIQKAQEAGLDMPTIRNNLLDAGWLQSETEAAFRNMLQAPVVTPPASATPPPVSSMEAYASMPSESPRPGATPPPVSSMSTETPLPSSMPQQFAGATKKKASHSRLIVFLIIILILVGGGYFASYFVSLDSVIAFVTRYIHF